MSVVASLADYESGLVVDPPGTVFLYRNYPQEGEITFYLEGDALPEIATPPAPPNFPALLAWFLAPGNALYEGAIAKVSASNCGLCMIRFQNLQQVITNPTLQRVDGLAHAANVLATSLATAGAPLTAAEVDAWNAQVEACGFPDSCKIVGGTP